MTKRTKKFLHTCYNNGEKKQRNDYILNGKIIKNNNSIRHIETRVLHDITATAVYSRRNSRRAGAAPWACCAASTARCPGSWGRWRAEPRRVDRYHRQQRAVSRSPGPRGSSAGTPRRPSSELAWVSLRSLTRVACCLKFQWCIIQTNMFLTKVFLNLQFQLTTHVSRKVQQRRQELGVVVGGVRRRRGLRFRRDLHHRLVVHG